MIGLKPCRRAVWEGYTGGERGLLDGLWLGSYHALNAAAAPNLRGEIFGFCVSPNLG